MRLISRPITQGFSSGTTNIAASIHVNEDEDSCVAAMLLPGADPKAHWGFTFTQDHVHSPPVPTSINSTALATLATVPNAMINCHISQFSTFPPKIGPTTYDWDGSLGGGAGFGLDNVIARARLAKHATGHIMITFGMAPGYMKDSGVTFEGNPTRVNNAHEQEFANLCGEIVARYPDVEYFEFWNELKGMYASITPGSGRFRYDYQTYVRQYNLIWTAVKAARPTAKLGGPYPVMSSWGDGQNNEQTQTRPGCTFTGGVVDNAALDVLIYFHNNALGYDFIAVDAWVGNDQGTIKGLGTGVTNLQQVDKWIKLNQWIRTNMSATKEIVWSEYYPNAGALTEDAAGDVVIETLRRTVSEVPLGNGIRYVQWGESVEPPRPYDYSTGAELPYIIPKLRAWEGV